MKFQPKLGKGRMIQLGCGREPLSAPWETYDQEVDISQPLPFPRSCAAFIHAEHVIEHVPFVAGLRFLEECYRVLEPGGVVRILFPDCERFMTALAFAGHEPTEYLDYLQAIGKPSRDVRDVLGFIIRDNGHKSAWTSMSGLGALHVAGFSHIDSPNYGESAHAALVDVDRHHLTIPREVVLAETTVLEGTK